MADESAGADIMLDVSAGAGVMVDESVFTLEESVAVVDSLLLLQATKAPAIANITKNFFIVLFGFS
jgi:hypothetical protein